MGISAQTFIQQRKVKFETALTLIFTLELKQNNKKVDDDSELTPIKPRKLNDNDEDTKCGSGKVNDTTATKTKHKQGNKSESTNTKNSFAINSMEDMPESGIPSKRNEVYDSEPITNGSKMNSRPVKQDPEPTIAGNKERLHDYKVNQNPRPRPDKEQLEPKPIPQDAQSKKITYYNITNEYDDLDMDSLNSQIIHENDALADNFNRNDIQDENYSFDMEHELDNINHSREIKLNNDSDSNISKKLNSSKSVSLKSDSHKSEESKLNEISSHHNIKSESKFRVCGKHFLDELKMRSEGPIETKSSPLLLPSEKQSAVEAGHSLDSKKINDAICIIDVESICKCLAHAVLKHIEFSQGKVLVDDLVPDDQDIPEFSYEFGKELKIDLEEIKMRKEQEEYEKYQNKMENYLKLQEMMKYDPSQNPYYYNYGGEDMYYDEEGQYYGDPRLYDDEQYRLMTQGIMQGAYDDYSQGDLPPVIGPGQSRPLIKPIDGQSRMYQQMYENDGPTADFYNYSLVQMDDFLQDEGIEGPHSTDLVNSYYNSLALMQQAKPFLFPPRDLGMVESLGSFENSSKYMSSAAGSNKITKAKDCTNAIDLKMSDSKITSYRRQNLTDNMDDEIPCEIEDYESESSEAEIEMNDDPLIVPKNQNGKKRKGGSPIILSNYSDSLKSLDASDVKQSIEEVQESYYVIEDITKEGLTKFLRDAMNVFNDKYNVETEKFEDFELVPPDFTLVYKYCRYVVIASKMEKEIPIIALVYLERLLTRTGILINQENWRRLVLTTLCLASKIWDDDSLENEHFPKVMSDLTLKEINTFERIFLDLIGYDLVVRGAEYAKYFFILRTLAEQNNIKMPLQPLSFDKVKQLQESSNKLEIELKGFQIKSYNHSM